MNMVRSILKRLAGWSAVRWYCLGVAVLWIVRAGTTLAAGADFGFPGDGWRSVFQLTVVAVALWGVRHRDSAYRAAIAIGVTYAVLTVLELFHGNDLVGVIPVDARDRVVHPLLAIVALACVLVAARRSGRRRIPTDA
jgi:hypothetical protein